MSAAGAACLDMQSGLGIEGDCNAHPLSPRQVLVTRIEDLQDFAVPPGGLRENVVVAGLSAEVLRPGVVLQLGEQVTIRLTFHCEPCKRIAQVVPSLKAVVRRRGVLGVVISGGAVAVEDSVKALPQRWPALPESPYERFLLFTANIPRGSVVTYRHVVIGMGVAESYMRAIPRYLQRGLRDRVPIHRIVDSRGQLLPAHVPGQIAALRAEGVDVTGVEGLFGQEHHRVDLQQCLWRGDSPYCS